MMRRSCLLPVTLILFAGLTSRVLADDGEWGDANHPMNIDWIGDGTTLDLDHQDADPWKGWGSIWVANICGQDWGDFHFQIKSTFGHYYDISNVDFLVDPEPELWICTAPLVWEKVEGLTWQVNNDAVGATLDLYFYNNPIRQGDWAKFKIYTDNTCSPHAGWFTVCGYPTPVPEPATIGLLGLGVLALLGKRK